MNWQKWAAAMSVIVPIIGALWWCSQNIVFAEDFNSHINKAEVRYLQSQKQDALASYIKYRQIERPNEIEQAQILFLKNQLEEYDAEIKAIRRNELNQTIYPGRKQLNRRVPANAHKH